jgi:hypothetical protein
VPHIDGRAEAIEGALDDVHRAHHAGAETARLSQNHPHARPSRYPGMKGFGARAAIATVFA